jgi:putative hydrolase of the HAD superfamily
MPAIRAITFDVGGTLIEPWPSVGHLYAEVAAGHGYPTLAPTILNRRFAEAWQARGDFAHSQAAWESLVDATFAGLVDRRPSDSFFLDIYARFAEPGAWRIFDDVIPTLEELASRGIPLAAISNWDERLRPLLKGLNLEGYFEAILVSCELYFTKPSNVIFEHALRKLGLPAGEVLHVGDGRLEDLNGARAAGLQARLIDRRRPSDPDAINSLTELLTLTEAPAVTLRG